MMASNEFAASPIADIRLPSIAPQFPLYAPNGLPERNIHRAVPVRPPPLSRRPIPAAAGPEQSLNNAFERQFA